ncbi:SGNH/GDSL hydrolase family protein [Paenibacillus koleovorans]|uniref:SGNH/GDSL hydrolase family protein n=1 Tax=Paenibacillus koleovorans TaxID=121608 RepID=UPI000FDA40FC|nr:SGNH/GDSL hydrolase family protein [Paenibacillus koleovorans]
MTARPITALVNQFRNCLQPEHNGNTLSLTRFSQQQLEHYADIPVYRARSLCPAGVCLDVLTDSAALALQVELISLIRPYIYFDVYVDDQWTASVGEQEPSLGLRRFDISLPPQPLNQLRRVTVYMPHNVELIVRDVLWPAGIQVQPAPAPVAKLLCLGDSITQGMDATLPSLTYSVLLSRKLGMSLLNQGVGGYHFNKDSLDPSLNYTPDLITIAYGTNDWGKWKSLQELHDRVDAYVKAVVEIFPQAEVCVLTPLWRVDIESPKEMGTFEQMADTIESAVLRHPGVRLIRGTELMPPDSSLLADNVHPRDQGFGQIAEKLAELIRNS